MGNSQKRSKILLLMWGITYIAYIINFFFYPVEGCIQILFSHKYDPHPFFSLMYVANQLFQIYYFFNFFYCLTPYLYVLFFPCSYNFCFSRI